MSPLLMTAVLVLAPADQPKADAAPDLNGGWLIVYAEEKGRRIQKWEQLKATVKDGALTYDRDGKDFTITLKFGDKQTVKATTGAKDETPAEGVCVAGQDYLCLSLNGGSFAKAEDPKDPKQKPGADFILILRKQRDK